ncbi:insulinase family protein [Alkalimarinus coralli]|uniref:insulinase family protein n=1 Tax=Alkalimarinus coralli TaxID=2935863 RepID=UPI00202B9F2F|nr:insulinase family protein [Alkalimarinus coralli]
MKNGVILATYWLLLAYSLVSFAQESLGSLDAGITKSPFDTRAYEFMVLPNKLEVLIISDQQVEKSAVSLIVDSGNSSDPVKFPGIAHLLEHIVSLGSNRAPPPEGFIPFVMSHGGNYNAHTALDYTLFSFDVSSSHLQPTLQRFGENITEPLLQPYYINSEIDAINAEFELLRHNEGWIDLAFLRRVMTPLHDYSKFDVGNSKTLKQAGVGEALAEFYQTNYSADRMKMVVVSNLSVEDIKSAVTSALSILPVRNSNYDKKMGEVLFAPENLPMRMDIETPNEHPVMMLTFSVPPHHAEYKTKAGEYIANLLMRRGKGSLIGLLKGKSWASDILVGTRVDGNKNATFDIRIDLTNEGAFQFDAVAQSVFQYLNLIRSKGVDESFYLEMSKLVHSQFIYQERLPARKYVNTLAQNMLRYPVSDLLSGPILFEDFNAPAIYRYLSYLAPEKVLLTMSGVSNPLTKTEGWSGRKYSVNKLDRKLLEKWQSPGQNDGLVIHLDKNKFVPGEKNLKPIAFKMKKPVLIDQSANYSLWYKQDIEYSTPKSDLYFLLQWRGAGMSIKERVLAELFSLLVKEKLYSESVKIAEAGLTYDIYTNAYGITINIGGFTDKQSLLLAEIMKSFNISSAISKEAFLSAKKSLQKKYQEYLSLQPYERLLNEIYVELQDRSWPVSQCNEYLGRLTMEELSQFGVKLQRSLQVRGLIHGNLQKTDALALGDIVKEHFAVSAREPVSIVELKTKSLKEKATKLRLVSMDRPDSAIVNYFQARGLAAEARAKVLLLLQKINPFLLQELRVKRKLGYVVQAMMVPLYGVEGIAIVLQSPMENEAVLQEALDEVLIDFIKSLENISEQDFEKSKNTLIEQVSSRPPSLNIKSYYYWVQLSQGRLDFDEAERVESALRRVDKSAFLKFSQDFLSPKINGRLILQTATN